MLSFCHCVVVFGSLHCMFDSICAPVLEQSIWSFTSPENLDFFLGVLGMSVGSDDVGVYRVTSF